MVSEFDEVLMPEIPHACLRCGTTMEPSKAYSDDGAREVVESDKRYISKLIECMKCPACGFSETIPEAKVRNETAVATGVRPEVQTLDMLRARVSAGYPIYFAGSLESDGFTAHIKNVERIRKELGMPVKVVYLALPQGAAEVPQT
jgi:hypothetical protein